MDGHPPRRKPRARIFYVSGLRFEFVEDGLVITDRYTGELLSNDGMNIGVMLEAAAIHEMDETIGL